MSSAALPPGALDGLHDVVVPEPVSLFPATTAWLVVAALLVAAAVVLGVRLRRRWTRTRYRREAAAELEAIAASLASPARRGAALAALPVLVKRVALQAAPRAQIASLSGDSWLRALDATWSEADFSSGPGRLLPELAYAAPARLEALPGDQVDALVELLRRWVPEHRAATTSDGPAQDGERAA